MITVVSIVVALTVGMGVYLSLSQQSQPSQPTGLKRFVLEALEFGFNQTNGGPTLRVKEGDTVSITLINKGGVGHELLIVTRDKLAVALNPSVAGEGREGWEETLGGHPKVIFEGSMLHDLKTGTSRTVIFIADKVGNYVYGCFLDGPDGVLHAYRGMWAEFIVEP